MESRRDAVAPAVERVLQAVRGSGLSDEQRENLAVAVAEALSNAAVHGNKLQPGRSVQVRVSVRDRRGASVEIADSGAGFDRRSLMDPTSPDRVLQTGGRGVFLMHQLVDRVEYNDVGNRVRLTMEPATRRR
jgi:serine/threonine-protein kinase RsbW